MEEKYLLAYNTVLKKIEKDNEMFPFFVVGLYSLLCEYKDFNKEVIDSFLDTDMYFEKGSIIEILQRHDLNPDDMDEIEEEKNVFDTYASTNLGHLFYFDPDTSKLVHSCNNPYIVATTSDAPLERLLNSFCHEMGHIIKGKINSYEILADEGDTVEFYFRTGLSYYVYFTEDGIIYDEIQNGILDEVINVFMTTDALKEVRGLALFAQDNNILDFISKLDLDRLEKDYGYEGFVELIKPLWKNERFKSLAMNSSVIGDEKLEKDFDTIEQDAFEHLSEYLDWLFNQTLDFADEDEKNITRNKCLELVKAYNEKYKNFVKTK